MQVASRVLEPEGRDSVKVTLDLEAMHNEFQTQMAVKGWELEMGKLDELIQKRRAA